MVAAENPLLIVVFTGNFHKRIIKNKARTNEMHL